MTAGAAAFAALHRTGRPFLLPNAWDVASALLLADTGFSAIGTTSLGVTAAAGLLDGVRAGRERTVALAAALAPRLPVPLTVDLEDGYSDDPAEVAGLVAHLAELGVAGVNLEDGRPDGGLRPVEEHAAVIAAVREEVPGMFVNARTDTHWLGVGPPGDRQRETLRRLGAYRDAGASGVFVPGLTDPTAIGRVTSAIDLPLNVLWWPGADVAALGDVGVARVSTGSALYRHALAAALDVAAVARTGSAPAGSAVGYDNLQTLLRGGSV